MMSKKRGKSLLGKAWYFIWEDDSVWSWLVNIILAFVLIKFVVYPGLGFLLGTDYPIVAVVSSSMEHQGNFEEWWENSKEWYEKQGITKEEFISYPSRNGFNKGDIMFLKGIDADEAKMGDIMVFISHKYRPKQDPIIHRVIKKWEEDGKILIQTKGDNYKTNTDSINSCDASGCVNEVEIGEEQIIGKAVFKIPFLGYIKIFFVEFLKLIGLLG